MYNFRVAARILCALLACSGPAMAVEGSSRTLSLPQALQRALAANPRLTAAERDIGIATGLKVQAGASSPAETLRAQVAADLFRVDRERARTLLATSRRDLAILMGDSSPRFGEAVGRLADVGQPPPFKDVVRAIEANPQLIRWT